MLDILAQINAWLNPYHPKQAVWIARSTPRPIGYKEVRYLQLELDAGILLAEREAQIRLARSPTDAELARILDYEEPKTPELLRSASWLPIVQALDHDGFVVQEMISSWERLDRAKARAEPYGQLRIVTMGECLARRAKLLIAEEEDAQRLETRPGRGQAAEAVSRRSARGLGHLEQGRVGKREQTDRERQAAG